MKDLFRESFEWFYNFINKRDLVYSKNKKGIITNGFVSLFAEKKLKGFSEAKKFGFCKSTQILKGFINILNKKEP
jgi:hypothetical protein